MSNLATTVTFNINIVLTFPGKSRTLIEFIYVIRRALPIQRRKSEIHHEYSKWFYTQDLAAQLTTSTGYEAMS
jgi:hypothetical protein